MVRRIAAHDEAAEDGQKGRALDQSVACGQFVGFQMIGQDAVFDRAEQGRDDAEAEEGGVEQGQGAEPEARGGDHLHADFGELQPPRDHRLVMGIRDLAAQRRQEQGRGDEDPHRQSDQRTRRLLAQPEEDEHGQHLAHEIVVKGGKELAPEQGRKTPRRHQLAEHDRRPRTLWTPLLRRE